MSDNRRVRRKYEHRNQFSDQLPLIRQLVLFFMKLMPDMFVLFFMSVFLLWGYDYATTAEYFGAEDIEVIGISRLSSKELLKEVGIERGVNLLSVNLSLIRKRLLNNPWIAEAEVRRFLPSGIQIRIKEHEPLAILDLGRKFILSTDGNVFKEWSQSDPQWLPVITGLDFSDIVIDGEHSGKSFQAVIEILSMGSAPKSFIPNHKIRRIHVDPEIGISLYLSENVKEIRLGYGNYVEKYEKLGRIFTYLKEKQGDISAHSIDVNDIGKIIINPIKTESFAGES